VEKDSFHRIYTAWYRKSFLYVKSYVHDDLVSEDIVAESLIRVWKKLRENEEKVQIAPFLFTILRNQALDHLKHEKIRRSAISDIRDVQHRELEIRLSALEASDPKDIFSGEVNRIIYKTLASLPDKTRLVFEMSRFEGKPYKEIAEFLEISVKGVDYHILQALNALRVALKDYLPVWFFFLPHF
jgi:RNA polymerase sigma-70 factor (ECF subfamily)